MFLCITFSENDIFGRLYLVLRQTCLNLDSNSQLLVLVLSIQSVEHSQLSQGMLLILKHILALYILFILPFLAKH